MEPSVSRFNSQSTNRTLVGSDDGFVSPLSLPFACPEKSELSSLSSPIYLTSDNKQWIDLDILSPKLVRELRRQYDTNSQHVQSGPLEKGAAKLKAFVRQTKLGVDIRFRRKVNAERDEVTDLHLVSNGPFLPREYGDEKTALVSELPAVQNEVHEIPDSSTLQELDGSSVVQQAHAIDEPLPRYEPGSSLHVATSLAEVHLEESSPLDSASQVQRRPSDLPSSVSNAPVPDSLLSDLLMAAGGTFSEDISSPYSPSDDASLSFERQATEGASTTEQGHYESLRSAEITEKLQSILAALQEHSINFNASTETINQANSQENVLSPFKLAKKAVYETETDAEPPSPVKRKTFNSERKAAGLTPRRKRSSKQSKARASISVAADTDSEEETRIHPIDLMRRRTIPKRLPAGSSIEIFWSSLIQNQAKILGAEHPLVYQAKSDLAHSRAKGYTEGSNGLSSLSQSKVLAADTLGPEHPWVATFVKDFETLATFLDNGLSRPLSQTEAVSIITSQTRGSQQTSDPSQEDNSTTTAEIRFEVTNNDASMVGKETSKLPGSSERSQPDSSKEVVAAANPAVAKLELPKLMTAVRSQTEANSAIHEVSPAPSITLDGPWIPRRPPRKLRSRVSTASALVLDAVSKGIVNAAQWFQSNYGSEQPVESGKVRVRWTCSCGEQLYDDFVEQRKGAACELEAELNRPISHSAANSALPASPSSSYGSGSYSFGSSTGGTGHSSQTSISSYSNHTRSPSGNNNDTKPNQTLLAPSDQSQHRQFYEPPWLLTCANEDRYTPKLSHLDMDPFKIRSDRDLAKSLREHYFNVNQKWWRRLRIRGLTSIEFVQLEVHRNRFADIRKIPDMPELPSADYSFDPSDLLPPVGSTYLLHLFKHPEDYDDERITYLRSPKRHGRLILGVGWGIKLVEGFLADRVWVLVSSFFAIASIVFAVVWNMKEHDMQAASGVAVWISSFGALAVGWLQAYLG